MGHSAYKLIAVKIGSNVLTRRDGTLDITRMSALVDQVAELHRRGTGVILVSSGAVASGRSLDYARILVWGGHLLYMILDVFYKFLSGIFGTLYIFFCEHYRSLYDLTA